MATTPYATLTVMTAPYTADSSTMTARRLRPDIETALVGTNSNWVVGCGLAAHSFDGDLLVVRLSDGASWTLTMSLDPIWAWIKAVGITCTEVFVSIARGPAVTGNLTRVRLDSLGPPQPP